MDMPTVGDRIIEWGQSRFGRSRGWFAKFAKAMEMTPQSLISYTKNHRLPGARIQGKLRKLGADVEWIMTGVSAADGAEQRHRDDAKRERTRVYFWAPDGVSDETRKIYERLAEIISKVPPEDADKIEAIVKAYMKSVLKGKKDS